MKVAVLSTASTSGKEAYKKAVAELEKAGHEIIVPSHNKKPPKNCRSMLWNIGTLLQHIAHVDVLYLTGGVERNPMCASVTMIVAMNGVQCVTSAKDIVDVNGDLKWHNVDDLFNKE